jgi:hypothetical protein
VLGAACSVRVLDAAVLVPRAAQDPQFLRVPSSSHQSVLVLN